MRHLPDVSFVKQAVISTCCIKQAEASSGGADVRIRHFLAMISGISSLMQTLVENQEDAIGGADSEGKWSCPDIMSTVSQKAFSWIQDSQYRPKIQPGQLHYSELSSLDSFSHVAKAPSDTESPKCIDCMRGHDIIHLVLGPEGQAWSTSAYSHEPYRSLTVPICGSCCSRRAVTLRLGGQLELKQRAFSHHVGNVSDWSRKYGPWMAFLWDKLFILQSLLMNLVLILVFDSDSESDEIYGFLVGNASWTRLDDPGVALLKFLSVLNALMSVLRVLVRVKLLGTAAVIAKNLPPRAMEFKQVLLSIAKTPRLAYEIIYSIWSAASTVGNLMIPFLLVEVAIGSFSMQLVGQAVWKDKVKLLGSLRAD